MPIPAERLKCLAHWINERWRILQRKEAGSPEPWTTDPILREYRFCNVRREDDRTTLWIADHWRKAHYDDPDVWHAMIVARMLNHTPSLHDIRYPKPWDPARVEKILLARQARGQQVFGAAYVIGNGGQSVPKVPYIVGLLDSARTLKYPPTKGDTLEAVSRSIRNSSLMTIEISPPPDDGGAKCSRQSKLKLAISPPCRAGRSARRLGCPCPGWAGRSRWLAKSVGSRCTG